MAFYQFIAIGGSSHISPCYEKPWKQWGAGLKMAILVTLVLALVPGQRVKLVAGWVGGAGWGWEGWHATGLAGWRGWRPSPTGTTSCPASQVPHSATAPIIFPFFSFNKISLESFEKKMHEHWWELVISDRIYVRRPEDGLEKLINCLFEGTEVTQTKSRLHCVVSDCFCGHQVQRRTSESRAA